MDEAAKKATLRMVPYGLYLVGARERVVRDPAKDLNAFVGSWVTQTSFKPPMLACAVKKDARSNQLIRDAGVFTLSILGAGQKAIAQSFFKDLAIAPDGRARGTMSGTRYEIEPVTGCPVFPDLPGWVACEVASAVDAENDHTLFVARVVAAGHAGPAKPLTHDETGWIYAG